MYIGHKTDDCTGQTVGRRYMAEILPIPRKTLYNQSINGQACATNDQVSANINHYADIIPISS